MVFRVHSSPNGCRVYVYNVPPLPLKIVRITPGHLSHHTAVDCDMFSPVASSLRQKLSECGQQRINQWLNVWSLHFLVLSPTLLAHCHPLSVVSQAVHHFSVPIYLRTMLHVLVPPIAYWPFYCGRCNHC